VIALSFFTPPTQAATPFYNITVSATSTNTVVTPTASFGKPSFVRVLNDGSGTIYVDFDQVAVADSSTAIKIAPCEGRDIAFDKYGGFTTINVVTATNVTASARVQTHYMSANSDMSITNGAQSSDRVRYVSNTAGCASAPLLTSNGAQLVPYVDSELITLNTGGTTTDTSGLLLHANSIIDGVTCRVITTITTAANYSLGDATTAARFQVASTNITAGQTVTGLSAMFGVVSTTATGPTQAAAAALRITTNVNPGAGVLRCSVFGRTLVAPTS
jgi:hypothetical protein